MLTLIITKYLVSQHTQPTIDPLVELPVSEVRAESMPSSLVSEPKEVTGSGLATTAPASNLEQLRQNGRLPLQAIATTGIALDDIHAIDEFASGQAARPLIEFPR
ncbi:hypothetical protein [Rhodococcus sp. WB9]|uniref:hypothetical protein n=1 Tax=Rhodococcus sp. WB9 TaxID=2594007 RepID=UPI001642E4F7|nr:hypothetical protein [Rhodococcus sp. WB9]